LDKITNISRKILPIYWVFLTFLLLKPGSESDEYFYGISYFDKFAHLSTFFLLGFLFIASIPRLKFGVLMLFMFSFAVITEILQEKMQLGRAMEIMDIVADTVGAFFGGLTYLCIKYIKCRKMQN